MAKTQQKTARQSKQDGNPLFSISRGTDRIQAQVTLCWELYYAERHREFEDAAATLRKLSPYHSRELFNEISDLVDGDE